MSVLNAVACHLDLVTGELLIKNHTDRNIGSYTCEVKNTVGKGQCKYALHAYNRKSSSIFTLKYLALFNSRFYML